MNRKYAGSFHLKPAYKIFSGNPKKLCDLTYLLININEASRRTGNALVFDLKQPFYL